LTGTVPPTTYEQKCEDSYSPPDLSAADDCDPNVATTDWPATSDSSACFPKEGTTYPCTYTVSWLAKDWCYNEVPHTQTVTVVDNTDPIITPKGYSRTTEYPDVPAEYGQFTATDNCAEVEISMEESRTQICKGGYLIIRTYTAVDNSGNDAQEIVSLTIGDTTPPVIHNVPEEIATYEVGTLPPLEPHSVFATDNSGDTLTITATQDPETVSSTYVGTVTRTYTAEDDCGNAASKSHTIRLEDTQPPTISKPPHVSAECDDVPPNCLAEVLGEDLEVGVSEEELTPTGKQTRFYLRRYSVSDGYNPLVEYTQSISISDTTKPVLSRKPASFATTCDCPTEVPEVTAVDNCDDSIEVSYTTFNIQETNAYNYQVVRQWTARDAVGNEESYQQTITVSDTEDPSFLTTPENKETSCANFEPVETFTNAAFDNCDPNPFYDAKDNIVPSGVCASRFEVQRTWTARDASNNDDSYTQTITVTDNEAPVAPELPVTCINAHGSNFLEVKDFSSIFSGSDNCAESVIVRITSCTDSQPAEGAASTSPQQPDCYYNSEQDSLYLRAASRESEAGTSRTYSLGAEIDDGCGNVTPTTKVYVVPVGQVEKFDTKFDRCLNASASLVDDTDGVGAPTFNIAPAN